jgi:UDP-N-acetylenolpyruvoylglucosamine reductase
LLVGQLEKLDFGLRELRRTADVELHERVDLRAWTALGVGGVAALVSRCHSASGVRDTLDFAASHGLGWVTLGGGSRLIAPDAGISVPVVSLTGSLARWEVESDGIVAGGGANMAQVCRAAARGGFSGLDVVGGSNRSVGGLVCAAVDGLVDLGSVVDWLDFQRPGSGVERWHAGSRRPLPDPAELDRTVILEARFRLRPSGLSDIRRRPTRPVTRRALRSTGPVFLDSPDATAADLLAEAGCSTSGVGGVRLGGPRGNELIAGRSATAVDVIDLCRKVRDRVLAETGVELVSSLVFVDEDGMETGL